MKGKETGSTRRKLDNARNTRAWIGTEPCHRDIDAGGDVSLDDDVGSGDGHVADDQNFEIQTAAVDRRVGIIGTYQLDERFSQRPGGHIS